MQFKFIKLIINILVVFMPFFLKRLVLIKFYHYKIHKSSKIGFSYIFPLSLEMKEGSSIGHFSVAINLEKLVLGVNTKVGKFNWITGHLKTSQNKFFKNIEKYSALIIDDESAITDRHIIDCTATIQIGKFSTIAGFRSQLLTHSINVYTSQQAASPIIIGDYCFVGTGCIILPDAYLPDRSILAAGSVLNKKHSNSDSLYAGVPAEFKKNISTEAEYFKRKTGVVY
jgi:acetyltransferase-like isoleucine patch superfamily enzyme